MSEYIRNRKFPIILSDKIKSAFYGVRNLDKGLVMDLLKRFRYNRVKYIGTVGLTFRDPDKVQEAVDLKPIPAQYFLQIRDLDEAFQELHRYRNGGAGEYAARDVERALNSERAKSPRKRTSDHQEIYDFLVRRKYTTSQNKKAIIADACSRFGLGERTIYRVARRYGLTRKQSTDR